MARRIRTVGAVVVANPRRKHRRKKGHRKGHGRARRNPRRKKARGHRRARRNPRRKHRRKARGHRKARRNPRRKKARGHRKARRGKRRARRNPGRKGRRIRVRGHTRRRARRNPGYGRRMRATAVSNPRRYRRYRRNPGISGVTSGLERMAGRVPVVGPLFAGMISLALPAAVGAVALEPSFQLAKWSVGQSWVPQSLKDSELAFFSLSGLLIGSAFAWLAPKSKFVSPATAKTLAVGIAGAGAGAGYVLWRLKSALAAAGVSTAWQELLPQAPVGGLGALLTAQGQTLGALNVSGYAPGYGMAPGYSVGPQGSFGPGGYGGFVLGAGAM